MTEPVLKFPLLGFGPDVGRYAEPGRERLHRFVDARDLSVCETWDMKRRARVGMVIADSAGRTWEVVAIRDLGPAGGLGERFLRWLIHQSLRRVTHEFVPRDPMSLSEVKERVCASIRANPDDWRDDEAIAGEAGPPRDEEELLEEMQAAVRAAETLPQLISALYDEE